MSPEEINKAAREIRKRKIIQCVAFIGWVPFGVSLWTLFPDNLYVEILIYTYFFSFFGVHGFIVIFTRCPSCKKYFFFRNIFTANLFINECMHCGLSIRKADLNGTC